MDFPVTAHDPTLRDAGLLRPVKVLVAQEKRGSLELPLLVIRLQFQEVKRLLLPNCTARFRRTPPITHR